MARRQLNGNALHEGAYMQAENASLAYVVQWGGLYTSAISTSEWSTEDALTISNESNTDHTATATLTAAQPGTYRATNKVTLADGTIDERHIDLHVYDNTRTVEWPADYN